MEIPHVKKQYDLTGLQVFFNEVETPVQLLEDLTQLILNYASVIDGDSVEFFKDDLRTFLFLREALKGIS